MNNSFIMSNSITGYNFIWDTLYIHSMKVVKMALNGAHLVYEPGCIIMARQ